MVKYVYSSAQRGLREWIVQRLSAIFMAVYVIGFVGYLLFNPDVSFAEWHSLFAKPFMKVAFLRTALG